jgi:hypothetical protein
MNGIHSSSYQGLLETRNKAEIESYCAMEQRPDLGLGSPEENTIERNPLGLECALSFLTFLDSGNDLSYITPYGVISVWINSLKC